MWAEKVLGFGESLMATTLETVHFQQQVLASTSGYWTMPWLLPQAMVTSSVLHTPAASERMLRKAMAPIHEKVVANANRLNEK